MNSGYNSLNTPRKEEKNMAKEFVRNIKETKLRGKNIEPLYTNEQNDLLSDKQHAYIRNNDFYFPLTQAILDLVSENDDGKNPVKPKVKIDGKENTATLTWDTKALGNNFKEKTPIKIIVDDEYNQIIIGIDDEALYRFMKPYFTSSNDIIVDFDDKKQTISYRLNDDAFFKRLSSHFRDGNGLDFVIDDEFKTVKYKLKDDKVKAIIFDTVEAKDDDLTVEQLDDKLTIDLSEKNKSMLKRHDTAVTNLSSRINGNAKNIETLENDFKDYKTDNDIIKLLQPLIDKYNNLPVKEVDNEIEMAEYRKSFTEENDIPSVYELNILEDPIITTAEELAEDKITKSEERYYLFVHGFKTYILNMNLNHGIHGLTKDRIDYYARPLKNLRVYNQYGKDYYIKFDISKPETIIYDLHTINSAPE